MNSREAEVFEMEEKGRQIMTRRARMQRAVEYMRNFMNTYDQQPSYADYSDETYINDVLYGLGVSLSGEYQFAGGFRKFRTLLREHLEKGNV